MITCIGDLIEDVTVFISGGLRVGTDSQSRIERHRGGSASNVAVATCVAGGQARFVGNVGDDPLGHALAGQMRSAGVELALSHQGRTGSLIAVVDSSGERSFLTDRGSCDEVTGFDPAWVATSASVHVPIYSLLGEPLRTTALHMLSKATELGVITSIDASSTGAIEDHGRDRVIALLSEVTADLLFCNGPEAELLGIDPGRLLDASDSLASIIVIKNGARPTSVVTTLERLEVPVAPLEGPVVDTTGAGDAFAAAFLLSLSSRSQPFAEVDLRQAVIAGHALAARTLGQAGATPV